MKRPGDFILGWSHSFQIETMKPSHSLAPRAQSLLRERTHATYVGLIIAGVLTIPTVGGPFMFALVALWQHFATQRLAASGELVKAHPVDATGEPADFGSAGESFASNGFHSMSGGDDEMSALFELVSHVVTFLGRFMPIIIIPYAFSHRGRWVKVNKYMFARETFQRDEEGQAWALIDPERPKLNHWLVSRIAP